LAQLESLIKGDLTACVMEVEFAEEDEEEWQVQLGFNMMIFQITKQIGAFVHSAAFDRQVEQERKNLTHSKDAKALLPAFKAAISELAASLFEKVYM